MNKTELKNYLLSEEARSFTGWDFSYIENRIKQEPLSWSYFDIVNTYRKEFQKLLDMGTGDGEFLLTLKHPYENTAVTEAYPPNFALCRKKLQPLGIDVRQIINDDDLPFDDNCFDIIINRHEAYDVDEISRILKLNGIFITQQVGGKNNNSLSNRLIDNFIPQFPNHNLSNRINDLEKAGFKTVFAKEEFPKVEFSDIGAVVYLAKIIKWEFPGFSVERCFDRLYDMYGDFLKGDKIITYQHRFVIVAYKL